MSKDAGNEAGYVAPGLPPVNVSGSPNYFIDVIERELQRGREVGTAEGQPVTHVGSRPVVPPDDTVEVTVIGLGTGESVVVHVGEGQWLIVDSFTMAGRGGRRSEPAPIQYLRSIGVEPAGAVKAVVVTHPHHDHYEGIEDVMKLCSDSNGVPPPLYVANPSVWGGRWNTVFGKISSDLEDRANRKKIGELRNVFAAAVHHKNLRFLDAGKPIEELPIVTAYTPLEIVEAEAEVSAAKFVANPNLASVVLWLESGGARALLGADMELDEHHGWQAVRQRFPFREAPIKDRISNRRRRAGVVKVSHHGSGGAHHPELYEQYADKNAYLVITRNLNSRGAAGRSTGLPDPESVRWMVERAYPTFVVGSTEAANEAPPKHRLGWTTMRRPRTGRGDWGHEAHGQADGPKPDTGLES